MALQYTTLADIDTRLKQRIQRGGTPAATNTIVTTLDGQALTYTLVSGDSSTTLTAASLATFINTGYYQFGWDGYIERGFMPTIENRLASSIFIVGKNY